jgi:hypothetical protein
MERYTALRRSSLKKDYTRFTIVVGIFIIAYALYRMDFWMAFIGAVVIYVTIYSKDVVIDKDGMTTHYHAIFYNKSRTYPFSAFTELRVQRTGGPEVILGFVRNGMNTPCLFTVSDGEAVIRLAKEGNPRLLIREIPARRRRGY